MNRTQMNKEARRKISELCENLRLERCELCGGTFGVAPAHKHLRTHYTTSEELADYREWICACVVCHEKMDNRSKTTREEVDAIFARLRGS
jgi:hypothetical protein